MVLGTVLTAAELEFLRTSLRSMVSIFIKNDSAAVYIDHRTEIERPFFAAKGFNTNSVHFLPSHHVIISNVHDYSFTGLISTCTDMLLQWFCVYTILCMKNYNL